jgi:ribosomal protein S18 acetylase RimI-like enzyme
VDGRPPSDEFDRADAVPTGRTERALPTAPGPYTPVDEGERPRTRRGTIRIERAQMGEVSTLADLWVELARGQRVYQSHLLADVNREAVADALARSIVADGVLVARDYEPADDGAEASDGDAEGNAGSARERDAEGGRVNAGSGRVTDGDSTPDADGDEGTDPDTEPEPEPDLDPDPRPGSGRGRPRSPRVETGSTSRPRSTTRRRSGSGASGESSIAGFVMFGLESGAYEQDVVRGVIHNLYVRPASRDAGIGSRLLSAAEAALDDEGADVVSLEAMTANEAAVAFYERHGYRPHRVEMEKPLGDPVESRARRSETDAVASDDEGSDERQPTGRGADQSGDRDVTGSDTHSRER